MGPECFFMCNDSVEKQGFAIFTNVLTASEVSCLVEEFRRAPLPKSRAGVRHALRHEAFAQVARDIRLVGLAQEILGASATPFRATLFDKSPAANWLVVWHQDRALPIQI